MFSKSRSETSRLQRVICATQDEVDILIVYTRGAAQALGAAPATMDLALQGNVLVERCLTRVTVPPCIAHPRRKCPGPSGHGAVQRSSPHLELEPHLQRHAGR